MCVGKLNRNAKHALKENVLDEWVCFERVGRNLNSAMSNCFVDIGLNIFHSFFTAVDIK